MVLTSALPQTKDPKPPMCVCVGGGFCLYWTVTVEMDTKEREGGGDTQQRAAGWTRTPAAAFWPYSMWLPAQPKPQVDPEEVIGVFVQYIKCCMCRKSVSPVV